MQNTIFIHFINSSNEQNRDFYHYKISGQFILSTKPIRIFEPYRVTSSFPTINTFNLHQPIIDTGESKQQKNHLLFKGTGFICNAERQCSLWENKSGYIFQLAKIARFLISSSGGEIIVERKGDETPSINLEEALIGPPLMLALAQKDIWSLHASAVSINNKLVLFAGESGKGKSTLAHFIHQQNVIGIHRITDDITPIAIKNGKVFALPDFPQLKIKPLSKQQAITPEELQITSVMIIDPTQSQNKVMITPLRKMEATLALVRNTVSSRLFPKETLKNHLDFSIHVSNLVRTYRLQYPHQYEILPTIMNKVAKVIEN